LPSSPVACLSSGKSPRASDKQIAALSFARDEFVCKPERDLLYLWSVTVHGSFIVREESGSYVAVICLVGPFPRSGLGNHARDLSRLQYRYRHWRLLVGAFDQIRHGIIAFLKQKVSPFLPSSFIRRYLILDGDCLLNATKRPIALWTEILPYTSLEVQLDPSVLRELALVRQKSERNRINSDPGATIEEPRRANSFLIRLGWIGIGFDNDEDLRTPYLKVKQPAIHL
jgi:hypothetical protein